MKSYQVLRRRRVIFQHVALLAAEPTKLWIGQSKLGICQENCWNLGQQKNPWRKAQESHSILLRGDFKNILA